MKRVGSLGFILLLLVSMVILPVQAAPDRDPESEIIRTEFGDFELKTTTIIYNDGSRSNATKADRINEVKYGGNVIAKITLSATFGYDGKTAWITDASGSHTTYSGWGYSGENIAQSGGTATLTATLSKLAEKKIPVSISLTCSPTGQIS